jgi:hypothetical protein
MHRTHHLLFADFASLAVLVVASSVVVLVFATAPSAPVLAAVIFVLLFLVVEGLGLGIEGS